MTPPLLSVCIPTYNRAALLRQSLAALADRVAADGLAGRVEVCVSDNCSTDDTPAVVREAVAAAPHVRWTTWRNPENIGGLRNIFRAADGGSGDYLSITGDDDLVRPGALAGLASAAETGAGLILVNSLPGHGRWVRRLAPADGTRRWFRGVPELTARLGLFHASFLGNLVFRRDVYRRHRRDEYLANAYPHTWAALAAVADGPALFVNLPLYDADDAARGWVAWQPRYTCLDMAEVQSDAGLAGAGWPAVAAAYGPLVRSVPRAVLHGRDGTAGAVRPAHLLAAYRRSAVFRGVAVGLWAVAAACPRPLLRRSLAWKATALGGRRTWASK